MTEYILPDETIAMRMSSLGQRNTDSSYDAKKVMACEIAGLYDNPNKDHFSGFDLMAFQAMIGGMKEPVRDFESRCWIVYFNEKEMDLLQELKEKSV